MGSRMFRLLLLGIFTALFMDEGDRVLTSKWIRYCHKCDLYDGYKCLSSMGRCWKFNVLNYERGDISIVIQLYLVGLVKRE
ncbi:prostate and testis expressed protein 13-like isoform X3 [Equus asinus]|uniref:prostate and testis expressed protein 13-like isoform X3 n=1 Tax=Equus asinus TaxID=9793 RepID=UPI0038F6F675